MHLEQHEHEVGLLGALAQPDHARVAIVSIVDDVEAHVAAIEVDGTLQVAHAERDVGEDRFHRTCSATRVATISATMRRSSGHLGARGGRVAAAAERFRHLREVDLAVGRPAQAHGQAGGVPQREHRARCLLAPGVGDLARMAVADRRHDAHAPRRTARHGSRSRPRSCARSRRRRARAPPPCAACRSTRSSRVDEVLVGVGAERADHPGQLARSRPPGAASGRCRRPWRRPGRRRRSAAPAGPRARDALRRYS